MNKTEKTFSPQFIICVFHSYSVPVLSRLQSLFLLVNQLFPLLLLNAARNVIKKMEREGKL